MGCQTMKYEWGVSERLNVGTSEHNTETFKFYNNVFCPKNFATPLLCTSGARWLNC